MRKVLLGFQLMACLVSILPARPQTTVPVRVIPATVFRPPSEYNPNWQRLLLLLSSTHYHVARSAEVDLDSCLIYAARLLGMSRVPVITESFDKMPPIPEMSWIDARGPAAALRSLPQLHGHEHLRQLVLLGAYYAFQPDSYHSYKDSVLFFLNAAREESRMLKESKWGRQALSLLGKMFVEGNALEQGAVFFDQCIKECQPDNDRATEAKAWAWRGLYTRYSPATTKDRIQYLQTARELYRNLKDTAGQINTLTDIGYLWVSDLQLKKGENAFREALRLVDSTSFPHRHYSTDNVAMVTIFEGKYGEPLHLTLQTINTSEALKDSVLWGTYYFRLAELYSWLDDKLPESSKWAQKAFDRFKLDKGNPFLYVALSDLADDLIAAGRPADALDRVKEAAISDPPLSTASQMEYHVLLSKSYSALKLFDKAEEHIFEATRLEKKMESRHGKIDLAFIKLQTGIIYFMQGQYSRAKEYLQQYLEETPFIGNSLQSELTAQNMLSIIDSASGNYSSSRRHLRRYISLQDSNFNIQGQRQAEELAVQYETEKKQNEIQLRDQRIAMLQQADRLREARLRQSELIRNMTIGAIIVLLLIGALLVRNNRQRQKMAKIVTEKNLIITRKNKMLEQLLTEKDWLLKEVNHRVKNNLHTVICLLESQAKYLKDEALEAIETSQHRIYAMSLIHQKIYQSDNVKTIAMNSYLREFVQYLGDSLGSAGRIFLRLEVDPLNLGVGQAIPVALIVNEAVTNSLKHAFPGEREGEVSIRLYRTGEEIILSISDNGIGMTPGVNITDHPSMGIELMKGLSREIRGSIHFLTENGTTIVVKFAGDRLSIPSDLLVSLEETEQTT